MNHASCGLFDVDVIVGAVAAAIPAALAALQVGVLGENDVARRGILVRSLFRLPSKIPFPVRKGAG